MDKKPAVFNEYARYYDLLYRDKDYEAEADYVAGMIRRHLPEASSVLELGSGTGKHASLLARRGFEVCGIERSEEMLACSQEVAATLRKQTGQEALAFFLGDIRTARRDRTFDAVISLFHVVSYQITNADVEAAFETARHHLTPGGVFVFDLWYGPAVLTERPDVRIKRMGDEKTAITRLAEPVLLPNENRVDVHYTVFVRNLETKAVAELTETHAMRYFFEPEIALWAAKTGFRMLDAQEWLTAKPIGPNTWGVCFCLQAL